MSDSLSLQLKRLTVHSELIRLQVVSGLFGQLRTSKATEEKTLKDVVSACLDSSFQVSNQLFTTSPSHC
jgi:hypothetical protein